jgi:hypothetical protein
MNDYTNDQLAAAWLGATETLAAAEREMFERLRDTGGTELLAEASTIVHIPRVTYDQNMLLTLREHVPPAVIEQAFEPEHEETRVIPARFNMRVAQHWSKRFGGYVAEIITKARLEAPGRFKVTLK